MTASSMEDQIRRLADVRAVREALFRYCRLVDSRDPAAIAAQAFAPDAVDDHGIYGTTFRGREQIEAMFTRSNRTTDSSAHFISDSEIHVEGDTAFARTYVAGWTWVWASADRGAVRPADWVFTGVYVDRLERTDESWLISERLVEPLGPGATGYGARPGAYDKQVDPAQDPHTTTGAS